MPTTDPKAELLAELAEAHAARLAAERRERELVARVRSAGGTWQEVADATKLKHRQEAEKKYSKHLIKQAPATYAVREVPEA